VKRGEMSTEEARRFVDDLVQQAQQQQTPVAPAAEQKSTEPRRIEIVSEEENASGKDAKDAGGVDKLREQVQNLQDELRRLKRD